ncbi:hypothetical protein LTR64_006440 [Lithohypha guttulata]|uniref:uncharacterized protein n=1 Tax=Lithohypha guttulata TaxID=1690604 RepID=UPI00315D76DB
MPSSVKQLTTLTENDHMHIGCINPTNAVYEKVSIDLFRLFEAQILIRKQHALVFLEAAISRAQPAKINIETRYFGILALPDLTTKHLGVEVSGSTIDLSPKEVVVPWQSLGYHSHPSPYGHGISRDEVSPVSAIAPFGALSFDTVPKVVWTLYYNSDLAKDEGVRSHQRN